MGCSSAVCRLQVGALLLRMYDLEGPGGGCIEVDGRDVREIDAR
jgi:hypothetical protein